MEKENKPARWRENKAIMEKEKRERKTKALRESKHGWKRSRNEEGKYRGRDNLTMIRIVGVMEQRKDVKEKHKKDKCVENGKKEKKMVKWKKRK